MMLSLSPTRPGFLASAFGWMAIAWELNQCESVAEPSGIGYRNEHTARVGGLNPSRSLKKQDEPITKPPSPCLGLSGDSVFRSPFRCRCGSRGLFRRC